MSVFLRPIGPECALLRKASTLYAERRHRNAAFGEYPDLFGEPGWDMMLDLFIAGKRHKKVAITSACIASFAAPTTALRHLSILSARGLVERQSDARDKRRTLVRLTPLGTELMTAYLEPLIDGPR